MDVGGWLRGLGLEQYEAAFRENAIGEKVLPNLTAEDLKDLGVGMVGHRRMLLDAIAALRAETSAPTPLPEAPLATDKAAKDAAERRQVTVMFSDLVGSSLRLTAESACSGSTRCAICRSKWEKTVTIRRLLKASRLAGLQEVEQRLNRAYRDVLRSLHLVDRNDPIAEIVAKTVIEIGATGVREPSEISKIAVKRLARLGRPRLEAPTGQEISADF